MCYLLKSCPRKKKAAEKDCTEVGLAEKFNPIAGEEVRERQNEICRRYIMGLFSKKKKKEAAIDELTPQIKAKLDELAEKGNQFEEEEQYDEAIQAWKEALSLIPEPQQFYSETIWFLAAIGDIYFQKKQYEKAHECFDKARGNLSGEGFLNSANMKYRV